jgi:CTP synthase (UTP-ammonia lyase)
MLPCLSTCVVKVTELEKGGLHFTGRDETGTRMEIVERDQEEHPFFFGR